MVLVLLKYIIYNLFIYPSKELETIYDIYIFN